MARVQHLEGFTEAVMGTVVNWRGLGPETLAAALAAMGADTSATITAGNVVVGPPVQGAIDVQSALSALDADKSAIDHVHAASVITFAPVGAISSTDVQAALAELDGEKSPVGHGHIVADVAGLQGALDAKVPIGTVYAASAITNAPAGTVTATTVQAALNQLDTNKSAVGHTHAASAIGVTPSGGISSTNVGAALAELDTEKSPVGHGHIVADVAGLQGALDAKVPIGTVYPANTIAVTPAGSMTQTDAQSALQAMLPKAGDTMIGPIVLSGDATSPLHPVSKRQLDAAISPSLLTIADGATGTVAYGAPLRQMLVVDTATDDYARFLVDTAGARQIVLDVATGLFGLFQAGAAAGGTSGKLNVYFSTAGVLSLKNLTGADVTAKITPGVMPVGGYAGAASGIVLANGDTVEQEFGATKRQANLSTDIVASGPAAALDYRAPISPKDPRFGAKGDAVQITGAVTTTAGGGSVTVAGAAFVTGDVGKSIAVPGAGTAGAVYFGAITGRTSATQVTVSPVTPTALAAVSKSVMYGTDDTAAIQGAIDYCWNGGAIRGAVVLPPGNYLISDINSDGYGIIIPDGVHFRGHGYSSALMCSTAIRVVQFNGLTGGTWRKGVISDFLINGNDIATTGLHLYSGAYYSGRDILAQNCIDAVVVDGSQNTHFLNIQGRDSTTNWKVLNGAGSVILEGCGSWAPFTRDVLLDNDAGYPGYAQRLSQGGIAYDDPTAIIIRGGVYEAVKAGGSISEVFKVVRGQQIILEGVTSAATPTNALWEVGAGASAFIARSCYLYHGSAVVDVGHLLGFNVIVTEANVVAALGDIFQIGNYGAIIRPNVGVQTGKVVTKHSSGSAFSVAQQITYQGLIPGGSTAGRPAATEYTNAYVRRYNYSLFRYEYYDPILTKWVVEAVLDEWPVSASIAAAGSVTPDLNAGRYFSYTFTGSGTVNIPSNMATFMLFKIRLIQDATGGWTVTLDPNYRIAAAPASGTANKTLFLLCMAISSSQAVVLSSSGWV